MPYSDPEKRKRYHKKYNLKHRAKLSAAAKKRDAKNTDAVKARQQAYYQKNRKKIMARVKAWNAANAERRRVYIKNYYLTRKTDVDAYTKRWRAENSGRVEKYYARNRKLHGAKYRAKQRADRIANPEKFAAASREYYRKNRAAVRAKQQEAYAAFRLKCPARIPQTPEQKIAARKASANRRAVAIKNYRKAYYKKFRDKLRERDREAYARLPESEKARRVAKAAAWAAAHPDRSKAIRNCISSLRRKIKRAITKEERRRVVDFYEWVRTVKSICCAYCGKPVPKKLREVDHVIPLGGGRGGKHLVENLTCACQRCNRRKHTKLPEEFLRVIKDSLRRRRRK